MIRRAALTAIALLLGAPSLVSAQGPSVTLRVAKTNRFVLPFGEADTQTVRVRLFKERRTGYELLDAKRVEVRDGAYRARFDRPRRGWCRVVVRTPDGGREERTFPCHIPSFGRGTATLTSLTSSVEIDALIADEDDERAYGLMYRPRMRDDLGMAFLYDQDTSGGFWMKNTLIPLSIAFFDADGSILRIMDMEPCTEDPCPSYNPDVTYRGALEVNQGMFEQWGISEGDRIEVTASP